MFECSETSDIRLLSYTMYSFTKITIHDQIIICFYYVAISSHNYFSLHKEFNHLQRLYV